MKRQRMYEAPSAMGVLEGASKFEEVERYIRSFEGPTENLIQQLEANIKKSSYSHVLGIDASGRIPALIIGDYIAGRSKELGEAPQQLFAVPNYTKESTPELSRMFQEAGILAQKGKKVLIVDDTLYKGEAIMNATRALRNHSIPFDIAIFLAVNNEVGDIERWKNFLKAENIFVGDYTYYSDGALDGDEEVPVVKNADLSGVRRVENTTVAEEYIPDRELYEHGRSEIKKLVEYLLSKQVK